LKKWEGCASLPGESLPDETIVQLGLKCEVKRNEEHGNRVIPIVSGSDWRVKVCAEIRA